MTEYNQAPLQQLPSAEEVKSGKAHLDMLNSQRKAREAKEEVFKSQGGTNPPQEDGWSIGRMEQFASQPHPLDRPEGHPEFIGRRHPADDFPFERFITEKLIDQQRAQDGDPFEEMEGEAPSTRFKRKEEWRYQQALHLDPRAQKEYDQMRESEYMSWLIQKERDKRERDLGGLDEQSWSANRSRGRMDNIGFFKRFRERRDDPENQWNDTFEYPEHLDEYTRGLNERRPPLGQ